MSHLQTKQISTRRTTCCRALLIMLPLCTTQIQAENLFSKRSSLGNNSANTFIPVDQAFAFSYRLAGDQVQLNWNITPGHYLYRDRIELKALTPGVSVRNLQYSTAGTPKDDPYFGKVTIFSTDTQLTATITMPPEGLREAELRLSYQGCAEAGLCYPPQRHSLLYIPSATPDQKN